MKAPKRVLIISYYVPPLGGPGIQRFLKFAKYLPRFGWEPIILGVKPILYHSYDETAEEEIPSLRIVRTESLDPTRILAKIFGKSPQIARTAHKRRLDRLTRWVIPIDSRLPWVPFALKEGRKILASFNPDVVISSSPPLSAHLVGLKLRRGHKKPWLADFRDAFLDSIPPPTPIHRSIQRSLFSKIREEADAFTAVTRKIAEVLELKGATVIENGFDPDDMEVEAKREDRRFVISYTGGLLDREYSFFPLLDALKEMDGVVLKLAGFLPPTVLLRMKDTRLQGKLEHLGYLPHREAIRLMKSSDVLWLTVHKSFAHEMVPIKLFEYIGVGKPILATVPDQSEIAYYIRKYNLGVVIPPVKEKIVQAISELRERGRGPKRVEREYFNKINQTKRLVDILEKLSCQ